MKWILFGFKNCGKTTIGKALAEQLRLPFVDTDRLIEKAHPHFHSCREIYRHFGEETFRKIEAEVVASLITYPDCVISLGAGAILNPAQAELLQFLGTLIYLKATKHLLKQRLLENSPPAFLDANDLEGSFEILYNNRITQYAAIPSVAIAVDAKSPLAIAQEIAHLLLGASHGQ